MQIVTYRDEFKDQVIRFIQKIWIDLGRTVNLEGNEKDLLNIPQAYQAAGGEFWVVLDDVNEVVGTAALRPTCETEAELGRLYLDRAYRGYGLGHDLVQRAISKAKESGFGLIKLDTSKKLEQAYGLMKKVGFKTTRCLDDANQTVFMEMSLPD
jgi:GNAT superfamily N-acetyltransferase